VQLARVLCQVWEPVVDGVPRYLFLDEPVSSLDIKHQLMIMDVARRFARSGGGVIAVLHDLNLTALYADAITALREGRVVASGRPEAVLTDRVLEAVFDVPLRVGMAPRAGTPFVLPQSVDLGEVASVA
jgi:iron complex transport system ATP-binding protein